MAKSYSLPPQCVLRPARPTDRLAIRMLAYRLSRWAIPASSHSQLIPQEIAVILAIAVPTTLLTFLILEVIGITNKLTDLEIFACRSIFWLAMILPFFIECLVIFQSKCSDCFVVACNGRLVAYAILFHQHKLTVLQYLFVAPSFRKQGIGSYLIQSLTQKTHKPLFLWSLPNKVRFYTGLGFVPAKQLFSTKIRSKLKCFSIGYQLLMYDHNQK